MSRPVRAVLAVLAALLVTGVLFSTAQADPGKHKGHAKGHLVVTVAGVEQTLPPGRAKKVIAEACAATGETLDIAAVRAAFPEAVEVCAGVTARSQVAEETPTTTAVPPS